MFSLPALKTSLCYQSKGTCQTIRISQHSRNMTPKKQAYQHRFHNCMKGRSSYSIPPNSPPKARFDAISATEDYIRRHVAALCNLLDALDDETGFCALSDLHNAVNWSVPDADAVESAVSYIHRVPADQVPSTLDRIGYDRNLPASDMTRWRWHGARVSELLARFRRAE